jgi:hypothetical protein
VSTDADRRELFVALEQSLGPVPAATLMELLPPTGWGDVARRADVEAQGVALRGEMAELRGEMAELRAELHGLIPRVILANIPVMFGVAGLVLAAAKLA